MTAAVTCTKPPDQRIVAFGDDCAGMGLMGVTKQLRDAEQEANSKLHLIDQHDLEISSLRESRIFMGVQDDTKAVLLAQGTDDISQLTVAVIERIKPTVLVGCLTRSGD